MVKAIISLALIITLPIPSYGYSGDISSKEYIIQGCEVVEIMESALDDLNTLVNMRHIMTNAQCLRHLSYIDSVWRSVRRILEKVTPSPGLNMHTIYSARPWINTLSLLNIWLNHVVGLFLKMSIFRKAFFS